MKETGKKNREERKTGKAFTCEGTLPPEEYLKKMLSYVNEDGVIRIARDELPEMAFATAPKEEDASLVEEFALDKKKANFDAALAFYNRLIDSIKKGSLQAELEKLNKDNELTKRLSSFARRVEALMKFENPNCPEAILHSEESMLIDSVLLYLGSER